MNFTRKPKQPRATWTRVPGAALVRSAPKRVAAKWPRKRVRQRSDKQAERMARYVPLRNKFMEFHPECEVVWFGKPCEAKSEDVHHTRGRQGDLLFETRWFLPVCRACHSKIETRKADAMKLGYIAPKGEWNVMSLATTKMADFYVAIPNANGTAIARRVCVQAPVYWDGQLWLMTEEGISIIEEAQRKEME